MIDQQYKGLLKRVYNYMELHDSGFKQASAIMARQNLMDDLRNAINTPTFSPRPPDVLPVRLTIIQNGTTDSYRVSLVSEHYNEMCILSDSLIFDGAHFELSNWTTWFRERNCQVEIVDSSNVYCKEDE